MGIQQQHPGWRQRLAPLYVIAVAYFLTCFGMTRSPDSEAVFRAAESLSSGQGLVVQVPVEMWPGFGTARGLDGRMYSVFGPGESIALAPILALVNATGLPDRLEMPPSYAPPRNQPADVI